MQPDAVTQPLADLRAIRARELESCRRVAQRRFLFPGADVDAGEVLRALGGFQLREVHHIHETRISSYHVPYLSLFVNGCTDRAVNRFTDQWFKPPVSLKKVPFGDYANVLRSGGSKVPISVRLRRFYTTSIKYNI